MIITSVDGRNIGVIFDSVQVKHIVEVLRQTQDSQYETAAKRVFGSGFDTGSAFDALAAVRAFTNLLGTFTDSMVKTAVNTEDKEPVNPIVPIIN